MEIDYEGIIKRAKSYFIKKGNTEEEAEDFAQNCAIKAFEISGYVSIEYMYLNYRDYERANKRIFSAPQGQLGKFSTISLATPIDRSDQDSAQLGDYIGDSRDELGDREEYNSIGGIINMILSLTENIEARKWATKHYYEWLGENAF